MNFEIERAELLKLKETNHEAYSFIMSCSSSETDYCKTLDMEKLKSECEKGYFAIEDLFTKEQIQKAFSVQEIYPNARGGFVSDKEFRINKMCFTEKELENLEQEPVCLMERRELTSNERFARIDPLKEPSRPLYNSSMGFNIKEQLNIAHQKFISDAIRKTAGSLGLADDDLNEPKDEDIKFPKKAEDLEDYQLVTCSGINEARKLCNSYSPKSYYEAIGNDEFDCHLYGKPNEADQKYWFIDSFGDVKPQKIKEFKHNLFRGDHFYMVNKNSYSFAISGGLAIAKQHAKEVNKEVEQKYWYVTPIEGVCIDTKVNYMSSLSDADGNSFTLESYRKDSYRINNDYYGDAESLRKCENFIAKHQAKKQEGGV